jgi:hypothetical protein
MYISSKFKCQLSFNWHLNLSMVCATQSGLMFNQSKLLLLHVPKTDHCQQVEEYLKGCTW